jgi:hypothetical protein
MKLYVYCLIGPTRHSFGYVAKQSEDEARGYAVDKFQKESPGHSVTQATVIEVDPAHILAHVHQNMQPPSLWDRIKSCINPQRN